MNPLLLNDTRTIILSYFNYGSVYKSGILTCKDWHYTLTNLFKNARVIFANNLLTLIKMLPDKPWDYDSLSNNKRITWEFFKSNRDKPWNYAKLITNENIITWERLMDNPDIPIDYFELSHNKT